jgi:hypothetical protein
LHSLPAGPVADKQNVDHSVAPREPDYQLFNMRMNRNGSSGRMFDIKNIYVLYSPVIRLVGRRGLVMKKMEETDGVRDAEYVTSPEKPKSMHFL